MSLEPFDLTSLIFLGTPAVNPRCSELVVLSKARMNTSTDTYHSQLVILNLQTKIEQPLYSDEYDIVSDKHSPKWSCDGNRVAFLRQIKGKNELWIRDMLSGKEWCLMADGSVKEFEWSPQGDKIAFVSRIQVLNNDFYYVQRLRYKLDGEGITNGYSHIFIVDVASRIVTRISATDSDHSCPTFFSDGNKLAYVKDFPSESDIKKKPMIQIFDLRKDSTIGWDPVIGSISRLLLMGNGVFCGVGKRTTENSVEQDTLFFLEEGQVARWLPGEADVAVGYFVLSDGRRTGINPQVRFIENRRMIVFAATTSGRQALFALQVDSFQITELPIPSNILAFDIVECSNSLNLVCLADSFTNPAEVFLAKWNFADEVVIDQITQYNDSNFGERSFRQVVSYEYIAEDETIIQGWSMQTERANDNKTLGTVLVIHGGPHLAFGDSFYFDFILLSSKGYRVVFCNPRGSLGYGQIFSNKIIGEWGKKDTSDVLGFLEMVVEREKVDGPLFIMGGSYGGYLVNWLISHNHRFRAAISERTTCNLYSKIGNCDLGFTINTSELGGVDLWTDEDYIMERSPIRYANQVSTPVLLIHGEQDHRCPIEQSEQWFNALRRLGKKVEFVRFPGASHGMSTVGRPKQRLGRLQIILEWFSSNT